MPTLLSFLFALLQFAVPLHTAANAVPPLPVQLVASIGPSDSPTVNLSIPANTLYYLHCTSNQNAPTASVATSKSGVSSRVGDSGFGISDLWAYDPAAGTYGFTCHNSASFSSQGWIFVCTSCTLAPGSFYTANTTGTPVTSQSIGGMTASANNYTIVCPYVTTGSPTGVTVAGVSAVSISGSPCWFSTGAAYTSQSTVVTNSASALMATAALPMYH